jgi:hypothetical protein
MTALREALVSQAPSLALQRSAQAEIAKLDARVRTLETVLHGVVVRAALGQPLTEGDLWLARDALGATWMGPKL